jgi:hypothetical protein
MPARIGAEITAQPGTDTMIKEWDGAPRRAGGSGSPH